MGSCESLKFVATDEQVCVSLYDWKTFPEQFAKSKHPDEKAFYKLLSAEVAPQIVDVLEVSQGQLHR